MVSQIKAWPPLWQPFEFGVQGVRGFGWVTDWAKAV